MYTKCFFYSYVKYFEIFQSINIYSNLLCLVLTTIIPNVGYILNIKCTYYHFKIKDSNTVPDMACHHSLNLAAITYLGFQNCTPIYLLFLPYLFSISVSFYSVSSLFDTFQMLSLPQALSLKLCFTHSEVISLSSVTKEPFICWDLTNLSLV